MKREESNRGSVWRFQHQPRSVLVVRPGALGDVLLTTPALRALRQAFPESHLAMLVTRPGKEILEGNSDVDQVFVLDKSSWVPQVQILSSVREKSFEVVIDFLCNPRTAIITRFSGAPYRVGYRVGLRRLAYNILKPRDEILDGRKVTKYAAEVNLDMVRYLGVAASDTALRFAVKEDARRRIDEFLCSSGVVPGKYVVISPSGSWRAKTWDVEKFARLGDLISEGEGLKTLIIWGPGEEELAKKMASLMKRPCKVACETTLGEAGALLKQCALFASNDSGLKHIAVALGTPTVTVYGPTNPITWNPQSPLHRAVQADVECLCCDKNECDSMKCMKQLSPETVFSMARQVLRVRGNEVLEGGTACV